jgi:hypothetical protein
VEREVLLEGVQRGSTLTACQQTAKYFTRFQRTQYLEINNPITTPTVFASMS